MSISCILYTVYCTGLCIIGQLKRKLWWSASLFFPNLTDYKYLSKTHSAMSCHVVCNSFVPFTGSQGPSVSGWGQGTPWHWTSCHLIAEPSLMAEAATQGANCTSGVQYLAQGHFNMQLSSTQPSAGIWASDLLIMSRSALLNKLPSPRPIVYKG